VNKNIQKIMARFKVMGYQSADINTMKDGYNQILDQTDKKDRNKSKEDLRAILTLRGLETKQGNDLKEYVDKFENWFLKN